MSWWFGCSGIRVLQTLRYGDNCKFWFEVLAGYGKQREAENRLLLAYSSLGMEANVWVWVCTLDLGGVAFKVVVPALQFWGRSPPG